MNTPHSIMSDAADLIYVADRGNGRIQVFDTSGKLIRIIVIDVLAPPDAPVAIGKPPGSTGKSVFWRNDADPVRRGRSASSPGPKQFLYVADAYPGRIYKLSLDGRALGWLGGSGKVLKKFGWIHELACPAENELYVAELLNWRAQKLLLHPAN